MGLFIFSNVAIADLTEADLRQIQDIVDKSVNESREETLGWIKWGVALLFVAIGLLWALAIYVFGRESYRIDRQLDRAVDLFVGLHDHLIKQTKASVNLTKSEIRTYTEKWKKEMEEIKYQD